MKTLLYLFAVVFLFAIPLYAQNPVESQAIPELQEWWRADDMQYGKYGMTWLDNFYQGKGALVVWTPQGVKTWLLRFPGDTMNVFTWDKGSANIKTGDFNGDGAIDYIDENGNIYQGIKNGQPPKAEVQTPVPNFRPTVITDINGDGFEDMLTPGSVVFGKPMISELQHEKLNFPEIDSNNAPLSSYMVSPKEMRVICRHYYWTNLTDFPFQRVYKEGLRLVRIWWNGNGFSSEKLDEFTVNTNDSTGIAYRSCLKPMPSGKYNFIIATMIQGKNQNTNVGIYDLSNDKLNKLYSIRMDNISSINALSNSLDTTKIPSLCINRYNTFGERIFHIYEGTISNSLHEIAQFKMTEYINLPITGLISLPDISGDGKSDIALSNRYRLSVLNQKDSISSVVEESDKNDSLLIRVVSPIPVLNNNAISVKVQVPQSGSYTLSMFDLAGKKVKDITEHYQLIGEKTVQINIGDYQVGAGAYTLRLEGYGKAAQCSILIE